MKKKLCIVATDGTSLINFRGPLIKHFVSAGYDVTCVSIEPESKMKEAIQALGAHYLQVSGDRVGTGFLSGFKMIRDYRRMFQTLQPDICFLYMSKPIAFGGYAAFKAGVKHIHILVNGLENAYYRTGFKDFIVRIVMSTAYRFICGKADHVFFQNHDDMNYFRTHKILKEEKATVVGGSGVDMNHFAKTKVPDEPVFLMVARLLWSKGIREFLEASSKLKADHPECHFLLVGGLDHNDESLSEEELNAYIKSAELEYCGYT
ncbi:MAG: glycosyltransferase, partial [Clostridia bacterium]|nr:glycosyltransferase [Clostridia bacterium]